MKIIGGEFALNLDAFSCLDLAKPSKSYFSSGRAALVGIIQHLKKDGIKSIRLPDYICESVVNVCKAQSININFYRLNNDLQIDWSQFEVTKENDCLLIVNYFGLINVKKDISLLRANLPKCQVILDNVQNVNENRLCGADFSFSSFRKYLGLPEGAEVLTRSSEKVVPTGETPNFILKKYLGGALKNNLVSDEVFLEVLNEAEKEMDECSAPTPSSNWLESTLSGINLAENAKLRLRNSKYLVEGLRLIGVNPILTIEENAPLFLPLCLFNRDELRSELIKRKIFCPIHWPVPEGLNLDKGLSMWKNEISLVIDQRYDLEDMDRILNVFEELNLADEYEN